MHSLQSMNNYNTILQYLTHILLYSHFNSEERTRVPTLLTISTIRRAYRQTNEYKHINVIDNRVKLT